MFEAHDCDGNGRLDRHELRTLLAEVGFLDAEIDLIHNDLDRDGDGAISFEEFVQTYTTLKERIVQASMDRLMQRAYGNDKTGTTAAQALLAEHTAACANLDHRLDMQRQKHNKELARRLAERVAKNSG